LYLVALDAHLAGDKPSRPWRLAFDASPDLPALRLVLLGINAHVNFDLPQALLAVISDADFENTSVMDSRSRHPEPLARLLPRRAGRSRGRRARGAREAPPRPGPAAPEPAVLQALPPRGPTEGLAQHRRAAGCPPRRPHGVRRAAGRAGGAQRSPHRRPARAR